MPDDAGFPRSSIGWDGTTYYGREQVKAAPFNNWLVGGYIFLAGLAGGTQLVSTLIDFARGREGARAVRRGRYLSLLGPASAVLLIADLHTPKRFYNMFRMFKATSPMSIGSWLLVGFGMFATLSTGATMLAERVPGLRWMRGIARAAQVPAAAIGAGIATYTASLLSATSTPLWAAAPRALAVRFGSSSIAAGAMALGMGEGRSRLGRDLDKIALTALAVELAATLAADEQYRRVGVDGALETLPGLIEEIGSGALGMVLPIGLLAASLTLSRSRSRLLSGLAALATLAGSATMRIAVLAAGDVSARRPDISMRFTQSENLPRA